MNDKRLRRHRESIFSISTLAAGDNLYGDSAGKHYDFYAKADTGNVYGIIMNKKFDLNYSTEKEVLDTARQMVLDAAASEFPLPLRKSVSSFISEKINF